MTGFGRASNSVDGKTLSVELKSVNSKLLDISCRYPSRFRELEPLIKQQLSNELTRGKVELFVNAESPEKSLAFNKELIKAYYNQLSEIQSEISPDSLTDLLPIVLRLPDVTSVQRDALGEQERETFFKLLTEASAALDAFRLNEGARASIDLEEQISVIAESLTLVSGMDQGRADRVKERLLKKLADIEVEHDESRLEQELVYYLEKLDINEEKVRLQGHLDFFLETIHSSDNSKGKKLGFIAQEMGREINTLGSKANDAEMQHLVVQMKECLEKIKEQVLNVL